MGCFLLASVVRAGDIKGTQPAVKEPPPVYSAERDDGSSHAYYEFGLAFLTGTGTHDVRHGLGGDFLIDYVRFSPLIINSGLYLNWSRLHTPYLDDKPFVSAQVDLDALIRPEIGRFKPYLGGGLTFYYNSWTTDESPWPPVMGPYDETVGHKVYKYGSGLTLNVRAGSQFKISRRISIFLDSRYLHAHPSVKTNVYNFSTLEEYTETNKYDMRTVLFSIGVVFRAFN
nr:hypothetical protein [candidate division Zixibacteria bacterium]